MLASVNIYEYIKPHYRSEGPRQGSSGVFGGVLLLSGLLYSTVEYLIAELFLNFIKMSPHYRWEGRRIVWCVLWAF